MLQKNFEDKILNIVSKAIKVKKTEVNLKSKSQDYENWDSLAQLSIISELDKLFKGKLSEVQDLASVDSISKIIKLLKKNKLI